MIKVGLMLIVKDGLILGTKRDNKSDQLAIVGGGNIEPESIEQTAIRECKEESGIDVSACISFYTRSNIVEGDEKFEATYFYALEWSGDIVSSDEGEVIWLTVDDLLGINGAFPEYNKSMLEMFKKLYPQIVLK